MKRCPACGATYPEGEFCPVDGAALVAAAAAWAPYGAGAGAEGGGPRDASEMLAGAVLDGRYRVEARIGAGGMGIVYRGTHVSIGKRVAIKVLRQAHAGLADVAERFAREAQLASQIKHPNVVEIFDDGRAPAGAPYYVMEFLEGHALAWEIDHRGRLDPARAIELALQVARGLGEAHRHGVVHRDLKPDNVFLTPAGSTAASGGELAKILDFGIARAEGARRLTTAGAVVGTPEYMSPEQAQGNEVDARTDLYALGIIIFEMLAGQVPFHGESVAKVLTRQVFEMPPGLRDVEPSLPQLPQIERVISRLLAKQRDERPGSSAEVAKLLELARDADLSGGRAAAGRATVAIGSWSVGDQAPVARRPEGSAAAGPRLSPPSSAVGWAGPAAPSGPSVVVRPGTPARHIPAPVHRDAATTSPAAGNGPVPRARGWSLAPVLVLGVGAAVFAALVTVTVVRILDRGRGTGAGGEASSLSPSEAMLPASRADSEDRRRSRSGAGAPPVPGGGVAGDGDPRDAPEKPLESARSTQDVGESAPDRSVEGKAAAGKDGAQAGDRRSGSAAASPQRRNPPKKRPSGASPSPGPAEDPAPAPAPASTPAKSTPTKRPEAPSVSLGDLKDPFSDE